MTVSRNIVLGLLASGGLLAMIGGAGARVVCNEDGDCWHNRSADVFPPALGLTIHDSDDWKWNDGEKRRWREHEGRGYWKGNDWREE